jgi:hypothetical protein
VGVAFCGDQHSHSIVITAAHISNFFFGIEKIDIPIG